ncbi:MAG: hypothetical protein ACJ72Z_01145, partial [Pyrinomonadaceae bacterium]
MTFPTFKNRSQKLERMDLGEYTPQEYALWAKEMRLVHGFLGERRAIRHSLIAEIRGNKYSEVS